MTYNPAEGFPRIMPSLRYPDVAAALDWLTSAFGFAEHLRWVDEAGTIQHAEMRVYDAYIELSAGEYHGPDPDEPAGEALVVLVDDVDAHHRRALAAGARALTEPTDRPWGLRQYTVLDLSGHRWEFSQHLRDVPPADWGARLAG